MQVTSEEKRVHLLKLSWAEAFLGLCLLLPLAILAGAGCLIQSFLAAHYAALFKNISLQGLRGICIKAVIIRVRVQKGTRVNFIHIKVSAKHLGREPRFAEGGRSGWWCRGLVADIYLT